MSENTRNIQVSEDIKVTASIKLLLGIAITLFSTLITMFTIFYFDMKDRDKQTNKKLDTTVETFKEDMEKTIDEKLFILDERQRKITQDIGGIKGDIKVILDRTSERRSAPTPRIDEVSGPPATTTPPPSELIEPTTETP